MQKLVTTLALGFLGLTFFVPTFISESLLFPFISGKNLLFRFSVFIVLACVAYLIYFTKKVHTFNTLMHKVFALFVGVLAVSAFFGVNGIRSFWSNFERMEGWFTLAILFIFFVVLYQCIENVKTWRYIVVASLIANAYILFFGLSQYFGWGEIFQSAGTRRPDATLGNSSYLGGYALMYIFLIAWLAIESKNVYAKVTYGFFIMVNFLVMALTLTRGSLIGVFAAFFVCVCIATIIFAVKKQKKENLPRALVLAPITLGLFILLSSLFFLNRDSEFVQSNRVLNRLATISLQDKSVEGRLINWGVSWEGFKESPILGHGQDNFLYVFSKHFDPRMGGYEPWYDRSHNVFFDWLIAGGILGLIGYLGLYICSLWMLWFRPNARKIFSLTEATLWTGFFVAYFTHNFFVFDNIVSYILFTFVLAYITWKSYVFNQVSIVKLSTRQTQLLVILLGLVAIFGTYYLVYKPWNVARSLIQGMQYSEVALAAPTDAQAQIWSKQNIGISYTKAELFNIARGKFEEATKYPLGRTEAREQLAQKFVSIVANQSVSSQEKDAWGQFTLEQLRNELERDPMNPRMYQVMGSLFLQFGKPKEALMFLNKAQELSPKKQLIMFDRASAYQLAGDYQKGLEISREAYELYPTFLTARARYIFALYRAGKDTEAQAMEPEFLKDALAQSYDLVTNKAYYDQVIAAKIDYRAREAVVAYSKGDMRTYTMFFNQIKELSPEAAERLKQIINANK